MDGRELDDLLARLGELSAAVVGDFCLDRYLHLDPEIRDESRETGLPIRQVARTRSLPGGAAAVLADLAALGLGRVLPVGFVGRDGAGFELCEALKKAGVDLSRLSRSAPRPTPTFTKPVLEEGGRLRELERFDVFPREALSEGEEAVLLREARAALGESAALIISDYGEAGKAGAVTPAVRAGLLELARRSPGKVFFADSRLNVGEFPGCAIKPNAREAGALLGRTLGEDSPLDELKAAAAELASRSGRPVFLTLGGRGMVAAEAGGAAHVPGFPLSGEIDPVGAGDSVTAAVSSALAAGCPAPEAGLFGVLVSSVTVQKIGETGTATPAEVRARFCEYAKLHPELTGGGGGR